jgi:hypothetical protein
MDEKSLNSRALAHEDHMADSTAQFLPPTDPEAYPDALREQERALLEERRNAARDSANGRPAIGFGLSGGGIRSATFMLGVFQALAERKLLRTIDFISTVSGGGYFGSFLGRLFTRDWVHDVGDVEQVLHGIHATTPTPGPESRARRVFRWLRDNGRYLAPRGSGDVLVLGGVLLRNWVAVQIVLVTTALTAMVGLQAIRERAEVAFGWNGAGSAMANLLTCGLPGHTHLWWSSWLLAPVLPFGLIAVPNGWAYWLVTRRQDARRRGLRPYVGVVLTGVGALAGMNHYWNQPGHTARFTISLVVAFMALLSLVYWRIVERMVEATGPDPSGDRARGKLSRWLTTGLVFTGALIAWAIVDTLGATVYAVQRDQYLGHWLAGIAAAFAGVGAFARPLMLLLAPNKAGSRPGIPKSIATWIAAVLLGTIWLVAINVGSHAIAWRFAVPMVPSALAHETQPQILGADRLVVGGRTGEFTVTARNDESAPCAVPMPREVSGFDLWTFGVLAGLTLIFGQTRTFANLSSIHTFYAARLTRTYLGASNDERFRRDTRVVDTQPNDDCAGDVYWRWPGGGDAPRDLPAHDGRRAYVKGGPLHIVNTTINETVDLRRGLQDQDRKGTILAVGPCSLSVGIRHHLITTATGGTVVTPTVGHSVWTNVGVPEPLTLGKWTSVSGAAFSAAAGANTTVPIAILAGLFNVRLGYWWDSGTPPIARMIEKVAPVQTALLSEMLARTTGTQGTLWNLSDGGHFENMGGYELIRRRLPLIVIIDAEADPDYTFDGLSDMVRKARLDFGAEITFLTQQQLSGSEPVADDRFTLALPETARQYFGDLDALRRGRWKGERQPFPAALTARRFSIRVERSRPSRAHAALAHVGYENGQSASWLVYVKATLMGDEPEDVCHYHRAHPDFPQETTTDQFFDEQQWESYRRLGLHIGHRVMSPELFDYFAGAPAPLPKPLGAA